MLAALVGLVRDFFSARIVLGVNTLSVTWGQFIFTFVLPLVGAYLVIRLIVFLVKRLVAKSQLKDDAKNRLMRWFRRVYRLLFFVTVVVLAVNLFGDEVTDSLGSVFTFLREPFFVSGNTQISVVTLLLLVPIFYLASWAANGTRRFLEAGVLDRLSFDASRRFSIVSLTRYGVVAGGDIWRSRSWPWIWSSGSGCKFLFGNRHHDIPADQRRRPHPHRRHGR